MGTLFLVATPIGNLEDMTLRALRVLRDVGLVACEDTRSARRLLDHYEITGKRLTSYTDHNKKAKAPQIIRALADGDVALVSDAGMPGISDPGYDLVVAASEAGHEVVPIPGASAVTLAVAASGLPSRRFYYLGFLPREGGPRRRALIDAAKTGDTLVVYESPHRVVATLRDAREALGDRRVAVCRELTKLHEEIWRGTLSDAIDHFASPRGEFTLVIEGGAVNDDAHSREADAMTVISELRARGATAKDATAELQRRLGVSRREAYRAWQERQGED
jgi:16S rRNA (cytidine1402-2'-O)-methyltransferase